MDDTMQCLECGHIFKTDDAVEVKSGRMSYWACPNCGVIEKMAGYYELDKYHYHEAIDRTQATIEILETVLINHPVIYQNEDLRMITEEVQARLAELYSEIGMIAHKFEEEVNTK